jgi:hypothetical protein
MTKLKLKEQQLEEHSSANQSKKNKHEIYEETELKSQKENDTKKLETEGNQSLDNRQTPGKQKNINQDIELVINSTNIFRKDNNII